MINSENIIPRAEQSRAEQSRAEQSCIRLGNAYNDEKYTGGNFGGNVWDVNGLAPAMRASHSSSEQCIVEVIKWKDLSTELQKILLDSMKSQQGGQNVFM